MKGGNTMQEKRTLYLAGKITGDPYYFTKFYNAQKKLEEGGFIVVNPALLPAEGFTWEAYMRMSGAYALQSAPKSVFFRTGKRAKARNMNSAKQWRRTSRFSSSLIGRGRRKKRVNTNARQKNRQDRFSMLRMRKNQRLSGNTRRWEHLQILRRRIKGDWIRKETEGSRNAEK